MSRPDVDYGYRSTVFFPEQPKILDINNPFIDTAYQIQYSADGSKIIGGSIFLNDAHTLSFVENGPKGKRPYYVAEDMYVIGTPEYPLGFFIPLSASASAMHNLATLLNGLADGIDDIKRDYDGFYNYEDFEM